MRGKPVRKTILYGSAGALLVAIGSLVLVFASMQDQSAWPTDGCGTLLWVVEAETSRGAGEAVVGLLCLNAAGATIVRVPEDLSVKRRDGRLIELGDLGESEGWAAGSAAVNGMLGLNVLGYVSLTTREVCAVLDALGPLRLERDGSQGELSGAEILASLRETNVEGALRWDDVTRAFFAAVGTAGTGAAMADARRLLARVDSDVNAECAWDSLRRAAQSNAPLRVAQLPTSVVVRDGVARRVVKAVEAEKILASAVREEAPLTSADILVAVFNGSGARLAATRAALYLQERGFRVGRVGNAEDFNYAATFIVRLTEDAKAGMLRDALPGVAKVVSAGEFGAHYEALRASIPKGTDLVLVVGAGMEFAR